MILLSQLRIFIPLRIGSEAYIFLLSIHLYIIIHSYKRKQMPLIDGNHISYIIKYELFDKWTLNAM